MHQKSIVSPGAKPAMVMYGLGVDTSHGQLLGLKLWWVGPAHGPKLPREQTQRAVDVVASGTIGEVQHVQLHMGAPLMLLFADASRTTWTAPVGVAGLNGFAWGDHSRLQTSSRWAVCCQADGAVCIAGAVHPRVDDAAAELDAAWRGAGLGAAHRRPGEQL